jgi:hypothetical protein
VDKFWLLLCTLISMVGFCHPANSTIINDSSFNFPELVSNGTFSDGLSGWTIDNPGNLPLGVSSVDIDGQGPLGLSDAFFVQTGGGSGSPDASIFQGIKIAEEGAYTLTANIAASYFPSDSAFINNLSGGIVTVAMGGKKIDMFDFGTIASNSWEFATLNTSFETGSPGIMAINFFRPFAAGLDSPINYLDNVSLKPNTLISEPVPEPATLLLFGSGLIGLSCYCRRRIIKTQGI